jgi:hypothetical protein
MRPISRGVVLVAFTAAALALPSLAGAADDRVTELVPIEPGSTPQDTPGDNTIFATQGIFVP